VNQTRSLLTVAVTGVNARPDNPGPGLAVARCLRADPGFHGRIIALGYEALDAGLYLDDLCDAGYLLPYPSAGEEALLDRLRAIDELEQIDVLIPCLDAELPALSRLQPTLAALGIATVLPSPEQLALRGKDRLAELAQQTGIAVPEGRRVTDESFFYRAADEGWDYPLVVKGLFYDAQVVHGPAHGAAAFRTIAAQWGVPLLVQRYIPGEEVNLTAIGDGKGGLLGPVMMKKRAVTEKGKAWAGISIMDATLLGLAERLVAALKWRGPLEVEVMRARNGDYLLIEINPRFPAWIYLSTGVGRNLPAALVQLALHRALPDLSEYRAGQFYLRHAAESVVELEDYEAIVTSGARGSKERPPLVPEGAECWVWPRISGGEGVGQMKQRWIRPTLTPHRASGLNKFGAVRRDAPIEAIDNVPVSRLMADYGSPLFVFSERRLRDNARRLHRAFSTRYPKVIHGWSYKTNYLGAICNLFHQEGSWAEVVSGFEYEKARALGVPAHQIIFNGPAKRETELRRAVQEGARIHVDHFDELALLERITADLDTPLKVGIRLNFETGYTEPWSRFGFHLESGQAMEAVLRIARAPRLQLAGLHCHIGTFITDTRAYAAQVRTLCSFMDALEEKTGATIDYLDIGGGFASRNALQGVYLPPEEVVPSFDQYAEAICDALLAATREREARGKGRPLLILESGRALVDDAGYLLTSVIANKRLPDGRRGVVLDAGVNLLFTSFWYHHPVRATRRLDGVPEETVLYGPLCMNIDVVRSSVLLPPLAVGETLALTPAGAYNNTQWLQFIDYRPNVVMVHPDGRDSLIRAAEDLAAVTLNERMPGHLATRPV